jgi:hypothetical protein
MESIAGPFVVATSVLAAGGAGKLLKPLPTAGAVRAVSLPLTGALGRPGAVRLLGGAEILLGAVALASGHRALAALVSAAYLAFCVFVVAALRSGQDIQSCGCLGETDVPPHWGHVVLNLSLAAASGLAATTGVGTLATVLDDQPLGGLPFLGLCGLSVWFSVVLLTVVPLTTRARERTA